MTEVTKAADPFKEKIVIVTGGGMELGRALCEELARHSGYSCSPECVGYLDRHRSVAFPNN
jgi:hypothetical protein